jgi:hypothetical protein
MSSIVEVTKELWIVFLTIFIIITFIALCFTVAKRVENYIEQFWKFVKYEFIVGISINIFL